MEDFTYAWSITQLQTYSDDTDQDVVQVVNWKVTATDNSSNPTSSELSGSTPLSKPDNGFINYADLTEDLVILWVQQALGELRMNETLGAVSSDLKAKTHQAKPLPWTQPKQITDKATAVPTNE